MWPHWVYLLCGVLGMWVFIACVGMLVWLKDEHEELFAGVVVLTLLTVFGLVFGQLAYDGAVKKAKEPRPPAEASP